MEGTAVGSSKLVPVHMKLDLNSIFPEVQAGVETGIKFPEAQAGVETGIVFPEVQADMETGIVFPEQQMNIVPGNLEIVTDDISAGTGTLIIDNPDDTDHSSGRKNTDSANTTDNTCNMYDANNAVNTADTANMDPKVDEVDASAGKDIPEVLPDDETGASDALAGTDSDDVADGEHTTGNVADGGYTTENVEEVVPELTEIAGFMVDEAGVIVNCTDVSVADGGLLVLPVSEMCTGLGDNALDALGEYCTEIYIPANITYIAPNTFASFPYLMYIEVASDNPAYYSDAGVLYSRDGQIIAYPCGR
jgi:hypothetical protein